MTSLFKYQRNDMVNHRPLHSYIKLITEISRFSVHRGPGIKDGAFGSTQEPSGLPPEKSYLFFKISIGPSKHYVINISFKSAPTLYDFNTWIPLYIKNHPDRKLKIWRSVYFSAPQIFSPYIVKLACNLKRCKMHAYSY